jgi:adenylate kinase family enzyme
MKYRSGRVIGMFGIPCSGKSTIIEMLVGASREIVARISSGDIARRLSQEAEIQHMAAGNLFPDEERLRAEILSLINKRKASGAEIIILDGMPRTVDQVYWLIENQFAGTDSDGCFIKVHCEPYEAIERAIGRSRDSQDAAEMIKRKIEKQMKMIDEMESWIFRLGIPYYTINNTSLQNAVETLSKYIGLKK